MGGLGVNRTDGANTATGVLVMTTLEVLANERWRRKMSDPQSSALTKNVIQWNRASGMLANPNVFDIATSGRYNCTVI